MDTFDKVIKAAEKLEILSNTILEDRKALTPLAILWAGYTVAEAIKEAATNWPPRVFRVKRQSKAQLLLSGNPESTQEDIWGLQGQSD